MSMVKQFALRSVHKVSELWQQIKFFETVLQMPIMCGRQLNSSSIITPRCRCSWTCSVWLFLRLRLRWSGRSWCFCLVVCSIFFVFAGYRIMALLSHQSDASFMLLSSSFWTVSVSLSDVFSEVSSANMSQLTLLLVICRGRSLIKIENRSGPKIDPWEIPQRSMPSLEYSPLT